MNLSKNFTLEELTATKTGLDNVPTAQEVASLKTLCLYLLQPLRDRYGQAITVNSGFRCEAVNKAVKGAKNSQHCKAEAADLCASSNSRLFHIIKDQLEFDQLIWEGGDDFNPAWVHVSYVGRAKNRNQILRMKDGKYYPFK